jgi:osmoprotectant transport system ATP-binding protein
MPIIRFENVTKSYDQYGPVIDNLNFSIQKGEFVTLIGPSGCGKTTLLKMINGLLKPDLGSVYINDREIGAWDIVELRRNMGYVIQQVGLFPHLTIAENISYVLDIKKVAKPIRRERERELIKLVGLEETYLDQYPAELSGGQKQRVGVARALAADPEIILMDEPFGAVDEITRKNLQDELFKICSSLDKTIVFVTHDIEEAFKLGSRIVLLNKGKIVQDGTKEQLIFFPQDKFVEQFFGYKSFAAFLSTTKIVELMNVNRNELKLTIPINIPVIGYGSSIMEGIKVMFDHGVDKICVVKEDKAIGEFDFSNINKYYSKG